MEEINIGFLLEGIKIEQFAVFEETYNSEKETELKAGFEFKLDSDNQKIGVFVTFEFVQDTKIFIKVVVSCHFKISDNAWKQFTDEKSASNKFIIPKGFITHLTMLSVGTTRGVLYAKTEGTGFAKFILPTINLSEMIQEDIILEEV